MTYWYCVKYVWLPIVLSNLTCIYGLLSKQDSPQILILTRDFTHFYTHVLGFYPMFRHTYDVFQVSYHIFPWNFAKNIPRLPQASNVRQQLGEKEELLQAALEAKAHQIVGCARSPWRMGTSNGNFPSSWGILQWMVYTGISCKNGWWLGVPPWPHDLGNLLFHGALMGMKWCFNGNEMISAIGISGHFPTTWRKNGGVMGRLCNHQICQTLGHGQCWLHPLYHDNVVTLAGNMRIAFWGMWYKPVSDTVQGQRNCGLVPPMLVTQQTQPPW